ncbi:delta fatty acid desaturase [Actinorhabdospora filicis]|uniref:Delta fatty acid desaturase n=1 Tax=Actinorhabdospora filicis TaxID=1785913 RepID=A0A9W6W818_9ACTN|nr:acyl-CoA desaturase [Actinorhabdospora filicis]GLZ75200.1 delta fatty acid desaturase [Actinorhabdospora filicis]
MTPEITLSPIATVDDHGYAELRARVRELGLLRRRPFYYFALIAVIVGSLAGGVALMAVIGDSWWQLALAPLFAVVFAQLGFLGHDAGHRQVFAGRRANDAAGLLFGNLGIGLAYGWWIDKHRRHHADPNDVERDPDVSGESIAFTAAQARARGRAGRLLARYQAWAFFPMLLLEGLALHVAGVKAVFGPGYRRRWLEIALLAAHVVIAVLVLLAVMSPLKALAFVAVQQGLFGVYLGCAFAPGHKGMPMTGRGQKLGFLPRQVLTTRNVTGSRFNEVLLGGLNFQIEHHLFPNMPRVALRHARPLVRRHLDERGLPYHETSLFGCYRLALGHLDRVGRRATGAPGESRPVR